MRALIALMTVTVLAAAPSRSQSRTVPGPALISRQSHVGDGALIGASIGGFAGTLVGLAERDRICPARHWLCQGPGAATIGMLSGLVGGTIVGGTTGAIVGAFIRTSGPETQAGLTVHL